MYPTFHIKIQVFPKKFKLVTFPFILIYEMTSNKQ